MVRCTSDGTQSQERKKEKCWWESGEWSEKSQEERREITTEAGDEKGGEGLKLSITEGGQDLRARTKQ